MAPRCVFVVVVINIIYAFAAGSAVRGVVVAIIGIAIPVNYCVIAIVGAHRSLSLSLFTMVYCCIGDCSRRHLVRRVVVSVALIAAIVPFRCRVEFAAIKLPVSPSLPLC